MINNNYRLGTSGFRNTHGYATDNPISDPAPDAITKSSHHIHFNENSNPFTVLLEFYAAYYDGTLEDMNAVTGKAEDQMQNGKIEAANLQFLGDLSQGVSALPTQVTLTNPTTGATHTITINTLSEAIAVFTHDGKDGNVVSPEDLKKLSFMSSVVKDLQGEQLGGQFASTTFTDLAGCDLTTMPNAACSNFNTGFSHLTDYVNKAIDRTFGSSDVENQVDPMDGLGDNGEISSTTLAALTKATTTVQTAKTQAGTLNNKIQNDISITSGNVTQGVSYMKKAVDDFNALISQLSR